ncbi:MAG: NFACT RNA binding domain-containing protein [Bacteroidetes bacterium]|nr:NFACT RNA binding domain-containing protein [Bacteroidota bacterium]
MYKNYFFLNRFVIEANLILKDSIINSIFSQEKDKLIIQTENIKGEKFVEISVNPSFPYITLKDKFNRARKNSIDIFEGHFPSRIYSLEIAKDDRIIKLETDIGKIYFAIRGKYTNVSLIDKNDNVDHFKNMPEDFSEDEFAREIGSKIFTSKYNFPEINIKNKTEFLNEIKKEFPFIGKEILNELNRRAADIPDNDKVSILNNIIKEIEEEKSIVIFDNQTHEVNISVNPLKIFPGKEIKSFENIISTLNYFIYKKYYFEDAKLKFRKIRKHLDNELQKVTSKLNSLKISIDRGSKEDEYKKIGNLLLINLNLIHAGFESVDVQDIYSENQLINIKLDNSLSPKKNIDKYFEKAKNDKIKLEKSKELHKELVRQFKHLKNIEEKFLISKSTEDFDLIMKELKIKETERVNKKDDIQDKFKHYIIEEKYHVYVGKDSKNNDLLTTQFAKQNDYWFHARSVPGSHVVLRVENNKEIIPKNILKKTASLAAYHSKAKTSGLAPVSYAQKKYVVKKKGMEPGKVALLKEDVLIVKPEIPAGCEYIIHE